MVNGNDRQIHEALNQFTGKRVLVTGGAGAIGNNLVRQLVYLGADVVTIDNLSSSQRENVADVDDMIDFIVGDIVADSVLARAFARPVDYVFHLAALFANQNSVEHPEDDLRTNGLGTLKLLKKSVDTAVQRFVFASSSCVYGGRGEALSEDMELALDTPYAITKALGEQYVQFFAHQYGLSTAIVRYFNSYGPGEKPGRYRNVIPNFFALAADGKALPITGSGIETRDFTFVEDIVDGTLLAAVKEGAEGEVFNLGTGSETCIGDLAEQINAIAGNGAGIERVPRRKWDQVSKRCACIDKARALLGYQPGIGLCEGLQRYWNWYEQISEKKGLFKGAI